MHIVAAHLWATVFSGFMLVWAVGLSLWYWTHPGRLRPDADAAARRAERRRRVRRVVMLGGIVLLAGAFFVGLNVLRYPPRTREEAVTFVGFWIAVVILLLAVLILALVEVYLVRRAVSRQEREVLTAAFRRRRLSRQGHEARDGDEGKSK